MAQRLDPAGDPYAVDIAGLDALDVPVAPAPNATRRLWAAAWPRILAFVVAIGAWESITLLEIKPAYVLPGPGTVFSRLLEDLTNGKLFHAMAHTMWRAGAGYGLAVVIGTLVGVVVSRSRVTRAAIGSLRTGLQTMPTIAWFPLAILLFGLRETAILFVVVLGAAPSIANGLISGVDNIPPILLRAGRVLGARGLQTYRHVVIPAALPGFVSGLKQGWAFAWRSLMAGELLVLLGTSLGVTLQNARDNSDAPGLIAAMIVILAIGIVIDSLFFARAEAAIRRRWGLLAD
jgi:NitT/TauT family transport system permease protein